MIDDEFFSKVRDAIDMAVARERSRQNAKWGEQNHTDGTGAPVYIHAAQAAKSDCQEAARGNYCNWRLILNEEVMEVFAETAPGNIKNELIQVMAVCKQWIEAIDRRITRAEQA